MKPFKRLMKQSKNQKGLASIVIVIVLVVLLSLISIGFARLMNRAVNNSLNNQLTSAASYAAQSGVNDAIAYIEQQPDLSKVKSSACIGANSTPPQPSILNSTNVSPSNGFINPFFAAGSGGTNTDYQYKCILVNPNPGDLQYDVPTHHSQVSILNPVNAVLTPVPPASFLF